MTAYVIVQTFVTDVEKMEEYITAGATTAVLRPVGDVRRTVEEIARATARR